MKTVSAPIEKTFSDYAEDWYMEIGHTVPPRGSEEWEKMYSEWSECISGF
jgi:hypothetical protein